MPCKPFEVLSNVRDDDPPGTPTKLTGSEGASQDDQNGQLDSDDSSDSDLRVTKKRKWNGMAEWNLIKRWVTGEKAEMAEEDIQR